MFAVHQQRVDGRAVPLLASGFAVIAEEAARALAREPYSAAALVLDPQCRVVFAALGEAA